MVAIAVVAILFGAIPYCLGAAINFVAELLLKRKLQTASPLQTESQQEKPKKPAIVEKYNEYCLQSLALIQADVNKFLESHYHDTSEYRNKIDDNPNLRNLCGFLYKRQRFNFDTMVEVRNKQKTTNVITFYHPNIHLEEMTEHLNFELESEEHMLLGACFSGTYSSKVGTMRNSNGGKVA